MLLYTLVMAFIMLLFNLKKGQLGGVIGVFTFSLYGFLLNQMCIRDRLKTVYRVRDIEVNTETRTVTKSGEEIDLQILEFEVLLMLIRHKNIAV